MPLFNENILQENPFDINLLDPAAVQLFRSEGDLRVRLTWNDERSWREVRIACALPFSDPDHYVGLRDENDKEIGMIQNPRDLDPQSLEIVRQELERRYFTPKVERVIKVREQMGVVNWDVETDRGRRQFTVRNLRDNSFPLGPNRLMMTDSEGNRYEFPNVTSMGSQAYLVLFEGDLRRGTMEILRHPDRVWLTSEGKKLALTPDGSGSWAYKEAEVVTRLSDSHLAVTLSSPASPVTYLHLRWLGDVSKILLWLGDAWERGYGDLEWRGIVPERIMPWYCLGWDGTRTVGYGVKTGPRAFCYWQADRDGLSLWIDLHSGGMGLELGSRSLEICEVVTRPGIAGESPFAAMQAFCQKMCPRPRLPNFALYGQNDWYYAYGNITSEQALRDARQIADLSPPGANRPYSVIDAGWQVNTGTNGGPWDRGNEQFPDMPSLAQSIRHSGALPGIWIRPLAAAPDAPDGWRLSREPKTLDPTVPEVQQLVLRDIARLREWGFDLIKHDFTTWDILGQWGFEMKSALTGDGWSFAEGQGRTTAEVILALYQTIHDAAAPSIVIGCNTVSHLSAGIFEIYRVGDDTSGRDWERTRKMGVNSLAFRAAQHGAFYAVDADCIGVTSDIDWNLNKQWLDLVAMSGTVCFASIDPAAVRPDQRDALKKAFARAATPQSVAEPLDWLETTAPSRWKAGDETHEFRWLPDSGADPYFV